MIERSLHPFLRCIRTAAPAAPCASRAAAALALPSSRAPFAPACLTTRLAPQASSDVVPTATEPSWAPSCPAVRVVAMRTPAQRLLALEDSERYELCAAPKKRVSLTVRRRRRAGQRRAEYSMGKYIDYYICLNCGKEALLHHICMFCKTPPPAFGTTERLSQYDEQFAAKTARIKQLVAEYQNQKPPQPRESA